MDPRTTAIILIGFQNDYFSPDGILRKVIEEQAKSSHMLDNTVRLLERIAPTPVTMISTPIIFTPDYSELIEPVGILKTIKDAGAFRAGTSGAEVIPEIKSFGEKIIEVPGKHGLNAFIGTHLDELLRQKEITDVVIAGVVTSICIDSTGRSAFEYGYKVSILCDCTCGRTAVEQEFFCSRIFPLYANVMTSYDLLGRIGV